MDGQVSWLVLFPSHSKLVLEQWFVENMNLNLQLRGQLRS